MQRNNEHATLIKRININEKLSTTEFNQMKSFQGQKREGMVPSTLFICFLTSL